MATGQYLTQLATALAERNHEVTIVTSDRGYDDPSVRFPRYERWNGIEIIRIPYLSLGKQRKWKRAVNFGSFLLMCSLRLLRLKRFDVVVALTSPPLISFLGALLVRLRGGRFCFWVMDLNPDEAIAAGWLRETSMVARVLQRLLNYSLKHANRVVVLDRFMRDRILAKGIPKERITIVPPWSHDEVNYDEDGRNLTRLREGLTNKFVVMYAGNHSPCHPLDTLLGAALRLKEVDQLVFCFVGGGSEHRKVSEFAKREKLNNVKCLPYQPANELSSMLSAADLHVVVMGNEFVGIVHPCKIYNILAVGSPTLYIGPEASHIVDIADDQTDGFIHAAHGDIQTVVESIVSAARSRPEREVIQRNSTRFAKQQLLSTLINVIEATSPDVSLQKDGAAGKTLLCENRD